MRNVKPIERESGLADYTREKFQPLLDALAKGDYDLATALTPEGMRLCGYMEYKSTREIEQRIGQSYTVVEVPPGVYPIFAREFQYDGARQQHRNSVRSLSTWVEGQCIDSAEAGVEYPSRCVLQGTPDTDSVAKGILDGNKRYHLLPPFEARSTVVEWNGYGGTLYEVVDSSLPALVVTDPIHLRNKGSQKAASLGSIIAAAAQKAARQNPGSHSPGIPDKKKPEGR